MINILDPDVSEILVKAIEEQMDNPEVPTSIKSGLLDASIGLRKLNIALLEERLGVTNDE